MLEIMVSPCVCLSYSDQIKYYVTRDCFVFEKLLFIYIVYPLTCDISILWYLDMLNDDIFYGRVKMRVGK